jgi:hypothetical protein
MSHFAQVINGIVVTVIVADQTIVDSFLDHQNWVQTSYNTCGGIHYLPNSNTPSNDQSKALRANYASIGYTYNLSNDVFYAPQPYPSWTISAPTWLWEPPVSYPTDIGSYEWDEDSQLWVPVSAKFK